MAPPKKAEKGESATRAELLREHVVPTMVCSASAAILLNLDPALAGAPGCSRAVICPLQLSEPFPPSEVLNSRV